MKGRKIDRTANPAGPTGGLLRTITNTSVMLAFAGFILMAVMASSQFLTKDLEPKLMEGTWEVCVVAAATDYSLGILTDTDHSRWVSDSGEYAQVENPILVGVNGKHKKCATFTSVDGKAKFNGVGKDTSLWHSYIAGLCPVKTDKALMKSSDDDAATCSAVKLTVDNVPDGKSSPGADRVEFCKDSYDLCWEAKQPS